MELPANLSILLALLWLIVANVIAFFPSKKKHWPAAYALMTVGFPLAIYVFYEEGVWMGLFFLAAAASILRWPLIFLLRKLGVLKSKS
ncbi:DUF2484 family protein [Falsihalocynthiibacter sp. SS001]|uniref:DUF2484 family protein n=1 Tax=Falsihalocynthiibacter sp. SS001 TaxID=3349698 RepID=UPI0036D38B0C